MKKMLCVVCAATFVFGTIQPIAAQDAATQVVTVDKMVLKEGSKETLKDKTDVFYALSLLGDHADAAMLKKIETNTLPVAEDAVLSERAGIQDVEKLILLVEGLGYDATAYALQDKNVNLFTLMEEKGLSLVNDYTFALEAIHSANYEPAANSLLAKDALITTLLAMRNPIDQAWNWNADYEGPYGSSDPDTTAMVLTALAPYANDSAAKTGISQETKTVVDAAVKDGFTFLASKQTANGAIDSYGENACSTAMVILAMGAYGKDVQTEAQFIKSGHNLTDGLMMFADPSGKGFLSNYTAALDAFTTEQGLRALLVLENNQANKPYYLYQAGAIANQNRFQEDVQEPQEKPAEVTKPVEKDKDGEPIIKNTADQTSSMMPLAIMGIMLMAGAGFYSYKRRA